MINLNLTRYYDPTPQEGGAGGTPPVNETEVKEFEALEAKGDQLSAEERVKLEAYKAKYDRVPVGSDGKQLTAEQVLAFKEIETKVNAIIAKPEAERTPDEVKYLLDNTEEETPTKSIYEQVDELRGEKLEVNYGEVKPESPEGILLREQTLEQRAALNVEKWIQHNHPRAYEFLAHLANGGKEEEFYKPENKDYLSVKLEKDNKVEQERILRAALELKGNSSEIIEAVVLAVKDGSKLFETATKELETLQQLQKQRQEAVVKATTAKQQKEQERLSFIVDELETKVSKGFAGIVIPTLEQPKFARYVADRINYDVSTDKYSMTKELDPKQLEKELQSAYFEFKGGDLKALVERKAETQNTRKIKGAVKYQAVVKTSAGGEKQRVPMSQL